MIKPQELRIGSNVNTELGIAEIIGIYEDVVDVKGVSVIDNSSENKISISTRSFDGCVEYEKIQPILLTEEILLKFGFERHDNGSVSAQFSYGINPVTQDYIIYLIWIKDYENDYQLNGFPFYQNGYFEIKTVHQLQNLYFALTNTELIWNGEI